MTDKLATIRREDTILDVRRPDTSGLPQALRADVEAAFDDESRVIAPATRTAYKGAWSRFLTWARERGLPTLPTTEDVVMTYASHLAATAKHFSTIQIAMSAIGAAHGAARVSPNPARSEAVRRHMKGIARKIGRLQKQKQALTDVEMRRIAALFPTHPSGVRDKALLLLWFVCASRRSEIVALNLDDLDFREDGLYVTFRKSKTDQEGKGLVKPVPYSSRAAVCPVRAVKAWIECMKQHGYSTELPEVPLFRALRGETWILKERMSAGAASDRIKPYVRKLGLDPKLFSGHSLRAGFATSAARKGRSESAIMQQTGHKLFETVMKYIRRANLMKDSAAVGLLDE